MIRLPVITIGGKLPPVDDTLDIARNTYRIDQEKLSIGIAL